MQEHGERIGVYYQVTSELAHLAGHELSHTEITHLVGHELYHNLILSGRATVVAFPPSSAALSALLPTVMSEDVIANLNEAFQEIWLPRHGAKTARRIWIGQAASIIIRHWIAPIKSLLDRAKGITTGR
jgi:hypothetical protein